MSGSNPTPEATTDAHVRVYRLGYGQWQCEHCGSRFAAMAGCQDCRKDGPEADELVEQRRAIVERVRPLLDASHAAEPLVLTEVWGGFSRWMDQLYDALTIIGEQGADGEEKLSHALTDMTRMRSAAAATPRRRPFVAVWLLVLLYTGPVALLVYVASCRRPAVASHQAFVAPRWKQAIGSTIHCLAGDATGIIAAAAITGALAVPMGIDLVIEYVAGFAFGLLIFQALFMKAMKGGSYTAWSGVPTGGDFAGLAARVASSASQATKASESVTGMSRRSFG